MSSKASTGPWLCSHCNKMNVQFLANCFRCDRPRPSAAQSAPTSPNEERLDSVAEAQIRNDVEDLSNTLNERLARLESMASAVTDHRRKKLHEVQEQVGDLDGACKEMDRFLADPKYKGIVKAKDALSARYESQKMSFTDENKKVKILTEELSDTMYKQMDAFSDMLTFGEAHATPEGFWLRES